LADFGHIVSCVDKDPTKIEALQSGKMPIFEPGLSDLVAKNVREGRLSFSSDLSEPVRNADAVFIAVGTPSRRGDGFADMSYVHHATREIAACLQGYTVVVTKSTVPVGEGDEVERIVSQARPNADFAVVSNPEFLREGAAISDFKRPDRIIIGTDDERAKAVMTELYRPLFLNNSPILFVSRRTAELTKYAANAFLATKITFINEIADLCEKVGANVQDVARGIGLDNRIGGKFLHAGPGYGGSCFPKDTLALIKTAQDHASPLRIVETVAAVNDQRKRAMARKIVTACGGSVRGKTIAVLGLTFKPNTDDMREAPSLSIITALHDLGASVRAYDPEGMTPAKSLLPEIDYAADPYDCVYDADAVVIVTEWDAFRALDFSRIRQQLRTPILVDLRNIYNPEQVARHGFTYISVGRATQPPFANAVAGPARRKTPLLSVTLAEQKAGS
jgi:UDPglucose 6-dehydrogenase